MAVVVVSLSVLRFLSATSCTDLVCSACVCELRDTVKEKSGLKILNLQHVIPCGCFYVHKSNNNNEEL